MTRQLARRTRHPLGGEIGGRADHREAARATERQRDHIAFEPLAEAHSGIAARSDDIDQRLVAVQLDTHPWIAAQVLSDQGSQHQLPRGARRVDPQAPGRRAAGIAQCGERGVDLFDTADTYGAGDNERLLGGFVQAHRDQLTLATKFGIVRKPDDYARTIDNSPEYVAHACDASLARLGIDCIDLYYCHRRDPQVPIEDVIGAMARLVEAGKVRALGLSEVSAETLQRAHAVHPIAALQSEYSLWSREAEHELLALCAELGSAFVAYSPLGRGFLTAKVTDTASLKADDFRRANPRFSDEALARNRRLVEALSEHATALGATPGQLALAWLLERNDQVVPIPGTKRQRYLEENVAAEALRLDTATISALEALFAPGSVIGERYPSAGMTGIER